MKQYLIHFRVLFLAFAWEKYQLTKIVSTFVKIRTRFRTNTEVSHVVGEWSWYKHSGMWWCIVGRGATFRKIVRATIWSVVRASERGFGSHSTDATARRLTKETKQRASYERWPLAANAVSMAKHNVMTSDTTEKDENLSRLPVTRTGLRHHSSAMRTVQSSCAESGITTILRNVWY